MSAGARIQAYDPEAMDAARAALAGIDGLDRLDFCNSPMSAAEGVDALVVVTEWSEFRNPNLTDLAAIMASAVIYDGRNIYEPEVMSDAGFDYHGIGRRN